MPTCRCQPPPDVWAAALSCPARSPSVLCGRACPSAARGSRPGTRIWTSDHSDGWRQRESLLPSGGGASLPRYRAAAAPPRPAGSTDRTRAPTQPLSALSGENRGVTPRGYVFLASRRSPVGIPGAPLKWNLELLLMRTPFLGPHRLMRTKEGMESVLLCSLPFPALNMQLQKVLLRPADSNRSTGLPGYYLQFGAIVSLWWILKPTSKAGTLQNTCILLKKKNWRSFIWWLQLHFSNIINAEVLLSGFKQWTSRSREQYSKYIYKQRRIKIYTYIYIYAQHQM